MQPTNKIYKRMTNWSLEDNLTRRVLSSVIAENSNDFQSLRLVCRIWRDCVKAILETISLSYLDDRLPSVFPHLKVVRLELYPRRQLTLCDASTLQCCSQLQKLQLKDLVVDNETNASALNQLAKSKNEITFDLEVIISKNGFAPNFPKVRITHLSIGLQDSLDSYWGAFSNLNHLELRFERSYLGVGLWHLNHSGYDQHWRELVQLPLRHLKLVVCSEREITRKEPIGDLTPLIHLTFLELHNCEGFEPQTLLGLDSLTALHKLRLFSCSAGNQTAEKISRLTQLKELAIFNCRSITLRGLSMFLQLTGLTRLELCPYSKRKDVNEYIHDNDVDQLEMLTSRIPSEMVSRFISVLKHPSRTDRYDVRKIYLNLDQSEFDDDNARQLSAIDNLSGLSLNFCGKLTLKGLAEVGKATNLRELSLVGNNQSTPGFLTFVSALSHLTKLDVSHTQAGPEDLEALLHCKDLRDLALANCGNIPSGVNGHYELYKRQGRVLNSKSSDFPETAKEELIAFKLRAVRLKGTIELAKELKLKLPLSELYFTHQDLRNLLRKLPINYQQVCGYSSLEERCELFLGTLEQITILSNLTHLDLSTDRHETYYKASSRRTGPHQISELDLVSYTRLPKLQSLNIAHNTIIGSFGLYCLERFPQLKNLRLAHCTKIQDLDLISLQLMKKITELDLSSTNVNYKALNWVATQITQLKHLNNHSLNFHPQI